MINQLLLESVCKHFNFEGKLMSISAYGDGHINDTYKVVYENDQETLVNYILQRINHEIFKETEKLMLNIENVTLYLRDMINELELDDYEVLELIKTKHNKSYYKHTDGNYYRAYVFIEDAIGHTFTNNNHLLYAAGKAFGEFQLLLKDYPVESLHETIKGFHDTPSRFNHFKEAVHMNALGRLSECLEVVEFVSARQTFSDIIMDKMKRGKVPTRVTHNDTKLNNVLIDTSSLLGRCVIDLDTVMPGSALFDFGDAIRSCGSTVAEDEEDLSLLDLDLARFEAYSKGYLEVMKDELDQEEIKLLADAAILMTFECGMRFLTDHLQGDRYFKVHKTNHNLIRAKNQFRFVEVMENKRSEMMKIVNKYC